MSTAPAPDHELARIREHLVLTGTGTQEAIAGAVRDLPGLRSDPERLLMAARARDQVLGSGPLQRFLDDPDVTDVLVNQAHRAWIDRGRGLEPVQVPELDDVRSLAVRLANAAGQRLDDAAPIAEGTLSDGTRIHAVLAPLAADGALICLRAMRTVAMTLDELRGRGFVDATGADVLAQLVAVRANVLVSGATGAGKTTLLAATLSLVPPDERIVCIEEAAELSPDHPHVVHLQVRRPNVQGSGGIGLQDLVRTAMRMRPDRLVLGECRGAEVREVLGALNTGHDGGWATVHANTAGDVPARLVALGAQAGLDPRAVSLQAVSALDAIVHVRRRGSRRFLDQIAVLELDRHGLLTSTIAASAGSGGSFTAGPGWSQLAERLDRS